MNIKRRRSSSSINTKKEESQASTTSSNDLLESEEKRPKISDATRISDHLGRGITSSTHKSTIPMSAMMSVGGDMIDPALLEMSAEELYVELSRLEAQREELRASLKLVKHRMNEVRRLAAARNAAQRIDDLHLRSSIDGTRRWHADLDDDDDVGAGVGGDGAVMRQNEGVITAEESTFPSAGQNLPYEVILEIFGFLRPVDMARSAMAHPLHLDCRA